MCLEDLNDFSAVLRHDSSEGRYLSVRDSNTIKFKLRENSRVSSFYIENAT